MIISQIIGGLGNQLFQYAAGFALATKGNTVLKLDITGFQDYALRNFELEKLGLPVRIASKEEIRNLLPSHNFEKALQYFSPKKKRTYYRQKKFSFDPGFHNLGKHVYLKGYFQSEKYFLPVKESLQQLIKFDPSVTKLLGELTNQVRNGNSVSIHVRRGDLSKNIDSFEYHGLLPKEYYLDAMAQARSKINNPTFYLFSDDTEWAKQNLGSKDIKVVSGEWTTDHLQDLYLMSQCRHNIIANSSYSWWGAWLNDHQQKIVIAPEKWFNKGPKDTQDLIPQTWIKI